MKLRNATLLIAIAMTLALCGRDSIHAQTYRNLVNTRWRTISNGPQSALIADVAHPDDPLETQKAVMAEARQSAQAIDTVLRREIAFFRKHGMLKRGQVVEIPQTVLVRHKGRLRLPDKGTTRGPGDELTFNVATTGNGAFNSQDALAIRDLVNLIYPELRDNILGRPGWTGSVTIRNLDPRLGKTDEVIGALLVINGNNVEIWFPTFRAFETRFLAMAQVIAQAFHARQRIGFDTWEHGMARAAAVALAFRLQSRFTANNPVDPSNGFYYTPYYDLLNQPALANNTFTPPTKSDQPINAASLAGMLVPRLQMSSTAWLKCFIENPNFFKRFNTGADNGLGTGGYYAAVAANANVANNVTRLREIARAALPTVELLDFDAWFEQQHILNSSVAQGTKLYTYSQPTFPTAQGNDSGAALFIVHYRTTSSGDEIDLSGTANLIYWDFDFQNRLFLPSFEAVDITNGFGSVAPFFSDIGGNPADKMRVAIDVPTNQQYTRIYFPAGQTGASDDPNDVSGVLVGANAGAISVTFDGGSGPITGQVRQGAFGLKGGVGAVSDNFSRTRISFTPQGGGAATAFQRNTYQRRDTQARLGVFPTFVFYVPGQLDTFAHNFPAGPSLISLPFRPLVNDLAIALGSPPARTLLAQYQQGIAGDDKYLRYPSLPLYQPGYGLWSSFSAAFNATNIKGERTDIQPYLSAGLPFGWTQIGTPYDRNLNVTSDIQLQYLGGEVLTLAQAISQGLVAAGIMGYSQTAGYQDITQQNPNFPRNTLEPWKGYWIRVLATEGVTLTYVNPNTRTAKTRAAHTEPTENGWRIPLELRDEQGATTAATFGQSSNGSDAFTPALHVASPPPFTPNATLAIRFPHTDWDTGMGTTRRGGDFLTDIRRIGARSQWDIAVTLPKPDTNYTLSWQGLTKLPRGTRLTLVDTETGARSLMHTLASYTFRVGKETNTRHFQILAEPRGAGRLRISSVAATPTNSRGSSAINIAYELSTSAETTLEIRMGGRTVRRLNNGRAMPSGINQLVWDGRDDAGRPLPSGTYTLEILARGEDNERTRSVTPLLLTR